MPLIEFSDKGLYCPQGQFYIDPWRPVARAVITHAHSDHARPGSAQYLCHRQSLPLLQLRLGDNHYQTVEWNEPVYMNGVTVSLHPAGHMIGSSQVRAEYNGEVWVISGDYKTEDDGISGAFEPLRCHVFVTESTFGLPIYNWQPQETLFDRMRYWVKQNIAAGKTSVLLAYSFGKAQRVIRALDGCADNILVHGAVYNAHMALQEAGWQLPDVTRVTPEMPKDLFHRSLVVAPGSAADSPWLRKMYPISVGNCSGWMQVRGHVRRQNIDAGFALSDHADWKGLLQTVKATGAEKVFVTHGFQSAFSRYLHENGIEAAEVKTEFSNSEEDIAEPIVES
jgi:putative mRNA 3-end processing factor